MIAYKDDNHSFIYFFPRWRCWEWIGVVRLPNVHPPNDACLGETMYIHEPPTAISLIGVLISVASVYLVTLCCNDNILVGAQLQNLPIWCF